MRKRILVELELNLAKMEQAMATIERHAAMGDPIATEVVEPLAKEIMRLKDACRLLLEQVIRDGENPEIVDVATEALWQFMAESQETAGKIH